MRGNQRLGVVACFVVAAVVLGMVLTGFSLGPADAETSTDPETDAVPTMPTDEVSRGDLSETKEETGSVDHGESWTAPIDATGIITQRHDKGTVVESGAPLLWVNNKPVILANGESPMYRTLELVGTKASKHLDGADVLQLQQFLLDEGFDDSGRMEADGIFGRATRNALKAWQKDAGLAVTGRVDRTQIVFHPGALRIEESLRVGSGFEGLQVTAGSQRVTVDFDNKSRPFLEMGGTVSISLDGEVRPGTITAIQPKVGEDGSQKLSVTIEPGATFPAGTETVKVTVQRVVASDVLLVPVRALLALAGGGYGVEVATSTGFDLRPVELGAVVDDLAEVAGELSEGDTVVVPDDRFGADE